ncbi:MAG: amidohydrolase family protein [Verrucomicrobiales bacterium]
MRIDSHQHFWKFDPVDYPWITDKIPVLKRDYLPADLEPLLKETKLDGTVAVQARTSLKESWWLLELARKRHIIKGVVGWVDLESKEVAQDLQALSREPKFKGVRHVLQDEPDDRHMMRPNFVRGISLLHEFGLAYDLLIYPKQLPAAMELVQKFPNQPFVLDHIAKPHIRDKTLEPWTKHIRELAKAPNVLCKVSGLVTEAKQKQWQAQDFAPYLDIVFEAFGEDRLMYGSDWPVALLGADDYKQVYGLAESFAKKNLSPAGQEKFFGANAVRFYRL